MVLKVLSCVLLSFVLLLGKTGAQNWRQCGVLDNSPTHLQTDNKSINLKITGSIDSTSLWKLPVVFHVLHDGQAVGTGKNISDAQILSQLQILNEDYRRKPNSPGFNTNPVGADALIEFELAKTDPFGAPSNGIVRVATSTSSFFTYEREKLARLSWWPPDKYINIWVCEIKGGFFGYAEYPESDLPGLSTSPKKDSTDGLMLDYRYVGNSTQWGVAPFDKGRTATHELGHFLGLFHTWGNTSSCSADDYCQDTPLMANPTFGCPSSKNSCPNDPGNDMIENYLDYSDDGCMNIFTKEQVRRMRYVLTNSPRRKSLMNLMNSVANKIEEKSFMLLCNPCQEELSFHLYTKGLTSIYSIAGVRVFSGFLESGYHVLPVSSWQKGIYLMEHQHSTNRLMEKLVIY